MEKNRSACPISYSLDIMGDKWSLLIIRDIMFYGKKSYSDFLNSEEKIASNILVNRLSRLESEKILIKEVSPTNKSKYEYRLSQKGAALLPLLIEYLEWGITYNENSIPQAIHKNIIENKENFINLMREKLRK